MPKSDRANSPSSASGDEEYTPSSRSDGPSQANSGAPGKRKRGRVNPAQLAYLERAYAADRSLDATRRKEISQKLGMDERQTQIWFQNRRAKAKLLAHRAREGGGEPSTLGAPIGLSVPPTLEDIKATLQEDSPIIMVPCNDVLIGKWRRMNTGANDLLVYLTECRRTLTYYVRSADVGFKMRIPFDSITGTEYKSEITPGCDRITLLLNKPPTFYREVASRAGSASALGRTWRPANDWTEGAQASTCTRHEIIGPSAQLGMALGPLSTGAPAHPTSNGVSSAGYPPCYFLPSPPMPYSSSSAANNNPSMNSPPYRSSPPPYFSGMPMETSISRPSTSNGVAGGNGFAFEPLHRRNRSVSQPPMQLAYNHNSFPQVNNLPISPHTTSLDSSGFPIEFNPFANNSGQANSQIEIGAQAGQQQQSFSQTFAPTYPQSDVTLLPQHMTPGRPLSSSSFRFPVTPPASQPGDASALGGPFQRRGTFDGFAPPTFLNTLAASPGHASRTNSANPPRFMDIYSSQNLNLAPYVLGNNGGNGSGNNTSMAPAPTQQPQEMLPFSIPLELPPNSPSRTRMNDTNVEQVATPPIYDHVSERVAFPA